MAHIFQLNDYSIKSEDTLEDEGHRSVDRGCGRCGEITQNDGKQQGMIRHTQDRKATGLGMPSTEVRNVPAHAHVNDV